MKDPELALQPKRLKKLSPINIGVYKYPRTIVGVAKIKNDVELRSTGDKKQSKLVVEIVQSGGVEMKIMNSIFKKKTEKFISFATRSIGKKSVAVKVSTQVYENNCRLANRQRVRPTLICLRQKQVKLNRYGNCTNFIRKKTIETGSMRANIRNFEVWIVHMPIEEVNAPRMKKNNKNDTQSISYRQLQCWIYWKIRSNYILDDIIALAIRDKNKKKKENNARKVEVIPTLWCRKGGREKVGKKWKAIKLLKNVHSHDRENTTSRESFHVRVFNLQARRKDDWYDAMKNIEIIALDLKKKKKNFARFAEFGY
ncbi:hypothetical protein RFI_31323 [Reticulomyxa filosa]|uniref:Uncharacterized protein n=1 Tax=Reticulomyxa filosa TaxID=46433 RepID=X6LVV8_RETFI|nr:hypothetical protein RFI_31323 [Reticulomyxa filosa]|eukprot:ETO06073.1 hypothetical protein RFI_31323 [Reticulomyxa filosa]